MSNSERLVAATGLTYPVLTVAAFALFPAPPGGDVSSAHDPAWLAGHTSAVIAQLFVRAVGAVGFLALGAAVSGRVGGTIGRLALVGGAGCSTLLVMAQAAILAAALGSRQHLSTVLVHGADTFNAALLDLSSLPAMLVFATAGYAFLTQDAPRWLGLLSVIGVPLAFMDALSYNGGPLEEMGLVGLAYFLVWSLLTASYLARRPTPLLTHSKGTVFAQ